MTSYFFFQNPGISISFSALDGTSELLEELASLLDLAPARLPGDVEVVVYSFRDPPPEVETLLMASGGASAWRSQVVRDGILIHESPDRTRYLCGIIFSPLFYARREVKWRVISFMVGSVLGLLSDRLLLIHGALIADGEKAHVLTAPSNVGKTTAASRVPPPWRAVTDDLVAAVKTPEGYALHPLPTWSQLFLDPDTFRRVDLDRPFSLHAVYLLEQSAADAVEDLQANQAITRLFLYSYQAYMVYFEDSPLDVRIRLKQEILMHARQIVQTTPCRVMKISRDGRFWEHFVPA
ncbi:MAG: hypothetical protein GXY82_04510 [Methanospirillum sp.]|nr:hypothetical protein [Methanospirillum sp.]